MPVATTFRRAAWLLVAGVALAGCLQLRPWRGTQADAARLAVVGEVCVVAPPQAWDPGSGLTIHAPRPVPKDARCPVCGMYPARAEEWAAQTIFQNGDTQFFDSPLTLFLYLQDVGRYSRGRQAGEIAASYVRDADSGRWLNAQTALYVHGSDAVGPMRAGNLPAFSDTASAKNFAARRGGTVLTAAQIGPQLLQELSGARRHQH
ncbi:MAG: nitrous oxide reductase accessory protein NosL [Burkholderiales bacterium]|nr:nitrous oxide reductase accessory protein NosL [Burkholderiales bacterium]